MIMSIDNFCSAVMSDMNGLIDNLILNTGRNSHQEIESWQKSLPKISEVLTSVSVHLPQFGKTHIYLGHMILEYKLPMASAWCDVVLIGNNSSQKPNIVIIENKHWDTSNDTVSDIGCFINHMGRREGHPSEQVKGYVEYCKCFHSAILKHSASVSGCVFFSNATSIDVYRQKPNENLIINYPVFSIKEEEFKNTFPKYIIDKISTPNELFAIDFEKGIYKQDRNMVTQVAKALKEKSAHSKPFVLLDKQRDAYNYIIYKLSKLKKPKKEKHVFIIKGPYGSGKSALAANLWIDSAEKYSDQGNIVFVTTSSSQSSNWEKIFTDNAGIFTGGFMVQKANDFNPGLTPAKVKQIRANGFTMDTNNFIENLQAFRSEGNTYKVPDNNHFLSIVDESHALINPVDHTIGFSSGWCLQAGPQAYHIIRASEVSIFLLHEDQSFRDTETTSIQDIYNYAKDLGAIIHDPIDLGGIQFRCGGSILYEKWIESLFLEYENNKVADSLREYVNFPKKEFLFELVDDPSELDKFLTIKNREGSSVRLASTYSVKWITKGYPNPHTLPPDQQDFHLKFEKNGKWIDWIRPWNYVAKSDYTDFIQANPSSEMFKNPLAEVGCPYVIRGFDFDYIGLLWLNDLVRRGDKWKVKIDNVFESALPTTMRIAREGNTEQLLDRVIKAYKILLTRAQKGIYLYISDSETREYIKNLLNDK